MTKSISMWDDDSLDNLLARLGNGYEDPYESEPECQLATSFVSEFTNLLKYTRSLKASESPQVIVGQYVLLEQIGHGGMGDVFRARHLHLQKDVALKILSKRRAHNFQSHSQFKNEILSAGRISHPGIVSATDAGEDKGIQFLVMEFVDGFDLGKLLNQRPPISAPEAALIVHQAAEALSYLHQQGMIHGDIKPSNIMLTKTGETKILDLGLTRQALKNTIQKNDDLNEPIAGTLAFLAPEYGVNGVSIDIRADLFSLGATLYMLVTGRSVRPYHNLSTESIRAFISEAVRIEETVPASLKQILHRLLELNPDDRYQTPEELIAEIEPISQQANLEELFSREVHQLVLETQPLFEDQLPTILKEESVASTNEIANSPRFTTHKKTWISSILAMSSLGIACWLWMANPSPNDESRSKVSSPSTPQSALVNENIEEQAEFSDGEHQLMEQFLQLGKNPDQISFRVEFTESKQEKQITDLTRLPDVPFEVLEIGEMAERVRLNNAQIDLLPKFRRLRFLYLDGRDLKTDSLRRLGDIRRLQRLHISAETLPEDAEAWNNLSTCAYFYDFSFHSVATSPIQVTPQFLASMSECKYLRSVEFHGPLSFSGITDCPLGNLSNLYDLKLAGQEMNHEFLTGIDQVAQLKQLSIQTNLMELETLNFLTSATSLQILTLSGSEEIDDQILRNFLETQTGLYQLQLTNFPRITGEVLPTFDKFHNLYRLSFRECPQLGNKIALLPNLPTLGRLELVNCGLNGLPLANLAEQTSLKWINLSANELSGMELDLIREQLPNTAVFSADE